jgi:hypothetical protein
METDLQFIKELKIPQQSTDARLLRPGLAKLNTLHGMGYETSAGSGTSGGFLDTNQARLSSYSHFAKAA